MKSRCQQHHVPSEILGRILPRLSIASGGGQKFLTFLSLQLHNSNLGLHLHVTFSPQIFFKMSSCKDTNHVGLRVPYSSMTSF